MKRVAIALFVLLYSLPMALNAAVALPSCAPGSTSASVGEDRGHGPCCPIAALSAACAFACQPTVLQANPTFDPAIVVSPLSFLAANILISGLDTQPPDPPPRA